MGELKEQLDRIESKIDKLLDRLGESPLEKRRREGASKQNSSKTSQETEISLEELNARLDKLI
ncbi:hypothetical protein RJP21_29200 [Paenibacillus sp. VCA1]|uniref:hypothetical protein n=1 Tax=Paenibacillus sp. VCA1 TaxID=3039148 RepID=UPI0028715819|nr:hypothetical protein [Paenibacillus sp. VCA1]MDR9857672.1 hypothetical protein [Paenibacillus sp. VCA1]